MGKVGFGVVLVIVSIIVLLLTIKLNKHSKRNETENHKRNNLYTKVVIIDGLAFFVIFFILGLLLLLGYFD
jgi:uncharacterized membrane protein